VSTAYKIATRITRVESKRLLLRGRIVNGETVFDYQDLGWFVSFDGSHESLWLGPEEPDLTAGQEVNLRIEPRGSEIQD
jgi:hypothetical protein